MYDKAKLDKERVDNEILFSKTVRAGKRIYYIDDPQSDLARYIFKDPYNFSFIGTVALQNELDIEKSLTSKITLIFLPWL